MKMRRSYFWNITNIILIINILFFIFAFIISLFQPHFFDYIALKPADFFQGKNIWTIFTSIFMHAGFFHLFVNMMSLFFLGNFLEHLIGSRRFLLIYIISGILGSFAYVYFALLLNQNLNIAAVGASGALFGVAGMLALLTPRMPVYIFPIPVAMPMWIGVIAIMAVLWLLSITIGLPIGNTAHLGGLIAGLIYAFYLKKKYRHQTKAISNMFH